MNRNQELFEKAPVSKAVAVMAIPTMISMLVVVIYNMADTFFIGQTNDPMKVAAVSLATPIFMVFMAIGQSVWNRRQFCYFQGIGENTNRRKRSIFPHSAVTVPLALVFLWQWFPFIEWN